ncbi:MAG: SDR family oxidoreductase [Deltaproteobacteria bacterium]|jgi:short-subunit dehydrogenase|nr:SDR family oxidoreductase [Deltaproteobacteria bacterium]MBT4089466.1 SDR family oxidoreductase [Deltaproteobacteria bacterium]MBT4263294.1 SDR family oxidoreductase [Deltaproteobacteria bacterium]MBT4641527.1 SDR family oxidoreductase [Deltaproteobacteria bacterium]MBT6499468.1 SDR family oxidoreductase [Deltaproteobacteria bacterium]
MKKPPKDCVILITGASSGFGKACADYLSKRDYRVYGTSRKADFETTEHSASPGFKMIPMDVCDQGSVNQCIEFILQQEKNIDVVINNAGFGIVGAIEDCSIEEFKQQFETNFFGVIRICQSVLPQMRKQGFGHLITIGSIAGLMSVPFQGAYSASKFALEGLIESLRMEIKQFGIQAVLVEPGDFNTGFTDNRITAEKVLKNPVYSENFKHALAVMESGERNGPSPEKLVLLIERIIKNPQPKLRYTVGMFMQTFAVFVKRLIPASLFESLIMKTFNIK